MRVGWFYLCVLGDIVENGLMVYWCLLDVTNPIGMWNKFTYTLKFFTAFFAHFLSISWAFPFSPRRITGNITSRFSNIYIDISLGRYYRAQPFLLFSAFRNNLCNVTTPVQWKIFTVFWCTNYFQSISIKTQT